MPETTLKLELFWVILAIGCVTPPLPLPSSNLVVQFTEGTIIDFDDTVSYICKDGHYFHRNFKQKKYELTCLRDGSFAKFDPLEFCIHPRGMHYVIKEMIYSRRTVF